MKKRSLFVIILAVSAGAMGQTGYRNLPWGLTKQAVTKTVFDWFDSRTGDLENALVYHGKFQGVDATYKFLFQSDSLYLVGISATLPYNLLESGEFKGNFRKSEAFVDGLISRLNQKYGKARLSEKLDTDSYSSWRNDETDIDLIVTRNTQYTIVLTYTWRNFLERRKNSQESNWKDEL